MSAPCRRDHAFSLLEILIVVAILSILATVLIKAFGSSTSESEQIIFMTNTRAFVEAASIYIARTGRYLPDAETGEIPEGWEDFIDEDRWTGITPIGGQWDTELDSYDIRAALGVHFNGEGPIRGDDYMLEIDELFDNGDLASGAFQKIADNRYYYILAEE